MLITLMCATLKEGLEAAAGKPKGSLAYYGHTMTLADVLDEALTEAAKRLGLAVAEALDKEARDMTAL